MSRWLATALLAGLSCAPSFADVGSDGVDCKPKAGEDYYPAKAIRRDQVGSVLIEYSVTGSGPPKNVVVVGSKASADLRYAAIHVIKSLSCTPDQQWMESGGPARRLRVNVLFKLRGVDETAQRLDPAAEEIVITGSPIGP